MWDTVLIGQTHSGYEIRNCIGKGGFAVVFEAVNDSTKTSVAFKILPPGNPAATLEFQREGELLAMLKDCDRVVRLHGTEQISLQMSFNGQDVPVPFACHILELAQGGSLEELVLARDRLDWVDRLRLWRGVILGVHQMHLHGVVHRDLKSQNCLLFFRPKGKVESKVTDLGRSRHLSSPASHSQFEYLVGLGDSRFAPPEFLAIRGDDSPSAHISSDLYGLGSILFELATGLGITAYSFGDDGPKLQRENFERHQKGLAIDLSGYRAAYEASFKLFESSVPANIRNQAAFLVRQLCDPEPSRRPPKIDRFSKRTMQPGLQWLLNRADILIKMLEAEKIQSSKRFARKGNT
ncbi:MAG: protein kinase [Actinomycetota bacterium]